MLDTSDPTTRDREEFLAAVVRGDITPLPPEDCPTCHGAGEITTTQDPIDGYWNTALCPTCLGSGVAGMTALKITGLDNATSFGVGSTITKVYWAVPEHYTHGLPYDTEAEAIAAAIADKEATLARDREYHAHTIGYRSLVPETVYVDLRWVMTMADDHAVKGSTDFTVRRTTYATLAEAREHLARIERFSQTGVQP